MKQAKLFRDISNLLTLQSAAQKQGRHIQADDLSILRNQAMIIQDGVIQWIGPDRKIPKELTKKNLKEVSLKGLSVLPGLVECHTHLIFAGHRAEEFEQRNQGVTYQEIAARGGGILSTMRATRKSAQTTLVKSAQERVDDFISQGVTTLEVKSGYALNQKDELKMLAVAHQLSDVRIVPTFLGAHALPPEFKTYEEYLDYLATEVLPQIKKKKLASRVDIFIEKGFFPLEASMRYLQKAQSLGFTVVIHADQLSLSGGADLAVKLGAHSADHLLQIEQAQIQAIAKSEVTAVLLPAADLYMKCTYPPARQLIQAGARVALATDFNPGSSPTRDVNLVGLLARLEMKMTLPEVLAAYTVGAAHALRLQEYVGSLSPGKNADFLCTEKDWQELFYSIGERWVSQVYLNGALTYQR